MYSWTIAASVYEKIYALDALASLDCAIALPCNLIIELVHPGEKPSLTVRGDNRDSDSLAQIKAIGKEKSFSMTFLKGRSSGRHSISFSLFSNKHSLAYMDANGVAVKVLMHKKPTLILKIPHPLQYISLSHSVNAHVGKDVFEGVEALTIDLRHASVLEIEGSLEVTKVDINLAHASRFQIQELLTKDTLSIQGKQTSLLFIDKVKGKNIVIDLKHSSKSDIKKIAADKVNLSLKHGSLCILGESVVRIFSCVLKDRSRVTISTLWGDMLEGLLAHSSLLLVRKGKVKSKDVTVKQRSSARMHGLEVESLSMAS